MCFVNSQLSLASMTGIMNVQQLMIIKNEMNVFPDYVVEGFKEK